MLHNRPAVITLCTALIIACCAPFHSLPAAPPKRDTVRMSEVGLLPSTGENATPKIAEALRMCREVQARVLLFDNGRYDIWPDGAEQREWFISNTSSERECPSKIKNVGILIEQMHDLALAGSGDTQLIFHGSMITIAVVRSSNILLTRLHTDYERPSMSEMVITSQDERGTVVQFHPDSRYGIDTLGRIYLYGEGWRSKFFHCIDYDPATDRLNYSRTWDILRRSQAADLGDRRVLFATPDSLRAPVGHRLSVRDIIRDHVGMFICESSDVELRDMNIHYMHGLGIVSQFSRNITMQSVVCAPRPESGRLNASSADFMHFSGCSGRIGIFDCSFSGAQDDPINVHGTNLRIVRHPAPDRLRLRFMHPQSYGFNAFSPADSVALVDAPTMQRLQVAVVREVHRISDREVEITLDRPLHHATVGSDCIENLTCTPEVEIRRCTFTHTNTRGTLVTTPRRVVIADNRYIRTGMSAILIEGDAEGWYESGPVCDVTIENNIFEDCGYVGGPANAVIALHPSNRKTDDAHPVHRNVRILNNRFITFGNPLLYAKSTAELTFSGNTAVVEYDDPRPRRAERRHAPDLSDIVSDKPFVLVGCSGVTISGNTIEGYEH